MLVGCKEMHADVNKRHEVSPDGLTGYFLVPKKGIEATGGEKAAIYEVVRML